MSYDIDQDFWEKKQGDGSSNPFKPGDKAKFDLSFPTKDMGLSKGWKDKGKDKGKGGKGKAVGKILTNASESVSQFTQNQKVDYSGINKSSRGNVKESDLTQPGHSDYFAKDNLQRGYEGPTTT